MVSMALTYERLEEDFVAWAMGQDLIRAAVVVGSRAQSSPPADEWSDLDLILFVRDAQPYLDQTAWFEQFGEVWMSHRETAGVGNQEWFILYAPGIKLDALIYPLPDGLVSADLQTVLPLAPFESVVDRGLRVLFDKNRGGEDVTLLSTEGVRWVPPTEAAFRDAVHTAFFTALNAAKFIRRGDAWRAVQRCNCELKESLLTFLEWQAHAAHPDRTDVWFEGRFIDRWVAPEAAARIPDTFAPYDRGGLVRALSATLDLFRWAAQDTARRLGYSYPDQLDQDINRLIRRIVSD